MRQPRRRCARSSRGSSPASSKGRTICTEEPLEELTGFLQVDAVLRDDHLQVIRGTAQSAPPLAVEDVGVVGVRPEHDAVLDEVQDRRVLRELTAPDGVSAVDRVPRPETLHARGGGVELLRGPVVVATLLDPTPDLRCVRLERHPSVLHSPLLLGRTMFYSSYVPLFVTRCQMRLGLGAAEEQGISQPSRASPRIGRGAEYPPPLPCAAEKVVGGGEARERRTF